MKGETIKQPVSKGVAKVPVIMQMEALECGAASLAMVLAYYGKWVPLEQVRIDCGISRDGSNARNIVYAARNYGLEARGMRYDLNMLRNEGTFPCILFWNFNHFVVCDGFKGDKVYINDPAQGTITVSVEEFEKSFTGVCLLFKPGESFETGGKKRTMFSFAAKRLKGAGNAVAFVVLTTIIAYLFKIINPAFSRFFMDNLLTGENKELLMPFIMLLGGLGMLQVFITAMQAVYTLRIYGKMSVIGNSTYMWKILKMPMEFFSQRMTGDIQLRQAMNASIATTLINTVAPIALNAGMMIFYLVMMLRYSPLLTLVGLGNIVLNTGLAQIISLKRNNITRVQMRDQANLSSYTVNGIQMMETIKANGAERGFFERWSGFQAAVNTQKNKYVKLNAYIGMIPDFFVSLSNYIILLLGVYLAIEGKFTLGMIMLFQSYMGAFVAPAVSLIAAGQTIQEMRTEMERVEDVMQYPEDDIFKVRDLSEDTDYGKLRGAVEMKNVTFGYSKLGKPLIRDFSITMKPGSRIALVGNSGCGKSTVSKLISGLYRPWSGEILFDGKPIEEIDRALFTGSVAVVDQDIILFEDTIENNIKMWDNSIEDFEMILAARDAKIHDDIMQRDHGYQSMLTEGGRNLSGGQRQRIEIARVLAQDPSIIIMDEATSALDAKTEYELVKSVKERGITCIVIAHRLSTIRDCDEIIVMDKGMIVERGTHDELYPKGGYYTKLVTSE